MQICLIIADGILIVKIFNSINLLNHNHMNKVSVKELIDFRGKTDYGKKSLYQIY